MLYEKTDITNLIHIEQIISFHYFEYVQDFSGIQEEHDFWEFVYVDCGEIWVTGGEKRVLLHSGQGYLHLPWEKHNVEANGIFASVIIFSFTCQSRELVRLSGKVLALGEREQKCLVQLLRYGQEFLEPPYDDFAQEKLAWKKTSPGAASQLLGNQMEHLFLLLLLPREKDEKKMTGTLQEAKDSDNILRIIRVLSGHLYDNLTLEQAAKEAAFSISYMEKLFRKELHTTVKDYHHRLKIEKAKEWICQGQMTFTEISERLGYGTIHNFSRVFKRYTNLSPASYQRTVKNRGLR